MLFVLSRRGVLPWRRPPHWKPASQDALCRSRAARTSDALNRTARPGNHHVGHVGVPRRRARVGDDHGQPWRNCRRHGVSVAGVAPPPLREAHATHTPATAELGGTDATALKILHRPATFSIGISSHAATVRPSRKKVTVSATHHAAVATDTRAVCQRVGVRVFASSATLSRCADASCGSTSSR